jgi:hypothetical protein
VRSVEEAKKTHHRDGEDAEFGTRRRPKTEERSYGRAARSALGMMRGLVGSAVAKVREARPNPDFLRSTQKG